MVTFKINGMPTEKAFNAMPFGRRIEHYPTIAAFKARAKLVHVSQKRKPWKTAIREALADNNATEYYASFECGPNVKDDSFEVWVA